MIATIPGPCLPAPTAAEAAAPPAVSGEAQGGPPPFEAVMSALAEAAAPGAVPGPAGVTARLAESAGIVSAEKPGGAADQAAPGDPMPAGMDQVLADIALAFMAPEAEEAPAPAAPGPTSDTDPTDPDAVTEDTLARLLVMAGLGAAVAVAVPITPAASGTAWRPASALEAFGSAPVSALRPSPDVQALPSGWPGDAPAQAQDLETGAAGPARPVPPAPVGPLTAAPPPAGRPALLTPLGLAPLGSAETVTDAGAGGEEDATSRPASPPDGPSRKGPRSLAAGPSPPPDLSAEPAVPAPAAAPEARGPRATGAHGVHGAHASDGLAVDPCVAGSKPAREAPEGRAPGPDLDSVSTGSRLQGPAAPGPEAAPEAREAGPRLSPVALGRTVEAVHRAWQGGMEVRIQLHPESLGDVRVQVRWEAGVLSARLEAGTPEAHAALEGGLAGLRMALREQGIPVEHLQVGLRLDLGSPGREPGRSFAQPSSPGSAPVARVEEAAVAGPAGRLDLRA